MTTARQYFEQGFAEGLEKGFAEGLEMVRTEAFKKGVELGRREVLRRALERRFGPLGDAHSLRFTHASAEDIDRWIDRVVDASSLDDALS